MPALDKLLVIAFAQHMAQTFNGHFIGKSGDPLMETVGTFLDAIHVQDKPMFMRQYTTTIGHNIYVPFTVGTPQPDGSYDEWQQIQVITHECEHIVQFEGDLEARKDVAAAGEFVSSYILDEHERAMWEAKAIRSNLELHYWRFGNMGQTAREWTAVLKHYGISAATVSEAEMVIDLSAETILASSSGKANVLNRSAKVAIDWLEANAPWLRERS